MRIPFFRLCLFDANAGEKDATPSPQEQAADHSLALLQSLALELRCNLLQQVWNLEVLGAFLKAFQAARA
jgi:hypothetical protein